jgi:hypothetical protein
MMQRNPYLVTINGQHTVRVFAYDAAGAVSKGSTVYEYTVADPEPCASVSAEADLRSANIESAPLRAIGGAR